MLENLIGSQIINVGDDNFTVRTQQGENRTFRIIEDEGDCCGYNNWGIQIFNKDEIDRNPIITKVVDTGEQEDGDAVIRYITLFGEYAPLVEINSLSSSGSGWAYGACVTLLCEEIKTEETITRW